MLKKTSMLLAATALAICASAGAAQADGCSGRDHTGGTIIGAIAGGVIGGAVSHGNGGAVVGGMVLGGLAGNAIARDMDCDDYSYASRSYRDAFDGPVGRRYEWSHGRNHGYIVVSREYREGRHWCRDFHQVVWRHGDRRERDGTACRRHGEWEIV